MPVNLPCFELCCGVCEALIGETGIGVIACIIGCAVACNNDTLVNQNIGGDAPVVSVNSDYWQFAVADKNQLPPLALTSY
jgi:hypothetical protein